MADPVDFAQYHMEEAERIRELQRKAAAGGPVLRPRGSCYNCHEPDLDHPAALFCDANCEQDYSARKRAAGMRLR